MLAAGEPESSLRLCCLAASIQHINNNNNNNNYNDNNNNNNNNNKDRSFVSPLKVE
jgi:hypothetical protein